MVRGHASVAVMIWQAVGAALTPAIAVALNPIAIAALILVLQSKRAKFVGGMFVLGWLVAVFAIIGIAFLLGDVADVDVDEAAGDTVDVMQAALGLLLLALAWRRWKRRPAPGTPVEEPKVFAKLTSVGPFAALGLGLGSAVLNVKAVPLAIAAGVRLAQAGVHGSEGMVAVAITTLVASCTIVGPWLAVVVFGERTQASLTEVKDWLLANISPIIVVILVILGFNLLGSALLLFR